MPRKLICSLAPNRVLKVSCNDPLDREQPVRLCSSVKRVCKPTVVDPYSDNQQVAKTTGAYFAQDLKIERTITLGTVLEIYGWALINSFFSLIRKLNLYLFRNFYRVLKKLRKICGSAISRKALTYFC